MRATAAQRRVSYVDRNVDPGYGRHDDQDTALSQLRGKASVWKRIEMMVRGASVQDGRTQLSRPL